MTAREQCKLSLIKDNIDFNKEAQKVTFWYHLIKDVSKLGDNWGQVTTMAL